MTLFMPYDKSLQPITIPEEMKTEVIEAGKIPKSVGMTETGIVAEAMHNPIGSKTLSELAAGRHNAVIICSDHTRPVPSRQILPLMLKELRKGNPDIEITLLIATGCHRGTTKEELIFKMGPEIVEQEHIIIHDCMDTKELIKIGMLPSGAELILNRATVETELLVSEGFIEPHFFAGFSGGRKSVLPGICSRTTVLGNHCADFIANEHARTGILEQNPVNQDMEAAARMAGLRYIVNVIIDDEKKVTAAFAGDPIKAHHEGCRYLIKQAAVYVEEPADIVVTTNGGYPMDQNIYQAVKGLTAAEAAVKPDGTIIMMSACSDGTGSDSFYHMLADCRSAEELYLKILNTPRTQTVPEQWEAQILARILMNHRVIFISCYKMAGVIRDMKMEYAPDFQTAFNMAVQKINKDGRIAVIPDGVSVIVIPRKN